MVEQPKPFATFAVLKIHVPTVSTLVMQGAHLEYAWAVGDD
jgi:hypothetical protein